MSKGFMVARIAPGRGLCYVTGDGGSTYLRGYAAVFHSREVAESLAFSLGAGWSAIEARS